MHAAGRRARLALVAGVPLAVALSGVAAQEPAADAPEYRDGDALVLPADYRSWPFLGAGLGMAYADEGGTPAQTENPPFSHVFVNPPAYRHFMETGSWPDGTVFVLEFRASASQSSINTSGHFATGLIGLEAEVKDARFTDGWAYYAFRQDGEFLDVAEPLPAEAAAPCVECHTDHGAVERTFVQFYPTLLDVAREKGTLNPGFGQPE